MESLQKKGITVGDRNRIKPLSMQIFVCCQPQSFGFRIGIRSSMFILMLNSMPLDVCWRRKGRLITPSTLQVDPIGNHSTSNHHTPKTQDRAPELSQQRTKKKNLIRLCSPDSTVNCIGREKSISYLVHASAFPMTSSVDMCPL